MHAAIVASVRNGSVGNVHFGTVRAHAATCIVGMSFATMTTAHRFVAANTTTFVETFLIVNVLP